MTTPTPVNKVSITTRTGFTVTLSADGVYPPESEELMSDLLTGVHALFGMYYTDSRDVLLDVTEHLHQARVADRSAPSEFDLGLKLGREERERGPE